MDTTTIEVSEATERLPELIEQVVEKNETFIISDNGKPAVALINLATLKNLIPPLPSEERRIVREKSEVKIANGDFSELTRATGASVEEIKRALAHFEKFGLVVISDSGEVYISPWAMKRATSDIQRRLASYLSGYELTENSYIVRYKGTQKSAPYILNTRISVDCIAIYFKNGFGISEIEKDYPFLTYNEIEAAVHYYLDHRAEINAYIKRADEIYQEGLRIQAGKFQ